MTVRGEPGRTPLRHAARVAAGGVRHLPAGPPPPSRDYCSSCNPDRREGYHFHHTRPTRCLWESQVLPGISTHLEPSSRRSLVPQRTWDSARHGGRSYALQTGHLGDRPTVNFGDTILDHGLAEAGVIWSRPWQDSLASGGACSPPAQLARVVAPGVHHHPSPLSLRDGLKELPPPSRLRRTDRAASHALRAR
jgi:hypothetical protein